MTIVYIQLPLLVFKTCPECNIEKLSQEFEQRRKRCKACRSKIRNRGQYCHDYYLAHKDQKHINDRLRYIELRDQRRTQIQAYARRNPLKIRENCMRRDARKRAATIGTVNYKHILQRDGMWCYICEKPILPEHLIEFDHVIPLARGGAHSEANIKPAHQICNRHKCSKLLEEMTSFERYET